MINNREQAHAIKVEILERRNYLKGMEAPLKYSKTNLYGGMQERVRRQADRDFQGRAAKRDKKLKQKLIKVNTYLINLSAYELQQNRLMDAPMIEGPVIEGPSAPLLRAPSPLNVVMPKKLKARAKVRNLRRGAGGRR